MESWSRSCASSGACTRAPCTTTAASTGCTWSPPALSRRGARGPLRPPGPVSAAVGPRARGARGRDRGDPCRDGGATTPGRPRVPAPS
jgi:hypothetical protein